MCVLPGSIILVFSRNPERTKKTEMFRYMVPVFCF